MEENTSRAKKVMELLSNQEMYQFTESTGLNFLNQKSVIQSDLLKLIVFQFNFLLVKIYYNLFKIKYIYLF